MIKKAKRAIAALLLLLVVTGAWGQEEVLVSQYLHNQFAINPAFAGSREGLTLFGGFRKQWGGIESSPTSILLTGHAPLRNEKMTLGLSMWDYKLHETNEATVLATVGYRTKIADGTWLGLALQPGVTIRSTDWSSVRTMEEEDAVFMEKETGVAPQLGFGVSVYGTRYFGGLSVKSLFVVDDFERRGGEFAPGEATYYLTGGYRWDVGESFTIQPSLMADYSKKTDMACDITVTGGYAEKLYVDLAYRTTKDVTIGLSYKPKEQLKIAYSYTLSVGDLNGYGSGSHEITLQYDFVYRVKAVGPRFY